MSAETAYPLYWPANVLRTKERSDDAPFSIGSDREDVRRNYVDGQLVERKVKVRVQKRVTLAVAVERLEEQLRMLGAVLPVLSTNLELRLNGLPRAGQSNPSDPGAVIWFTLKGKRMAMPSDHWIQVADNIAALAAHIRATRAIERYGVATVEQAFSGYVAIEDHTGGIPWRRVLGFKDDDRVTLEAATASYHNKIKRFHTDLAGGSHDQAAELNRAINQARAEFRV